MSRAPLQRSNILSAVSSTQQVSSQSGREIDETLFLVNRRLERTFLYKSYVKLELSAIFFDRMTHSITKRPELSRSF
jgi:hypothetical protein